jgi:BirA family biotin operon repressor/biotin-[acetyl-CoA-carboxylase] ligase
MQVKYFQTLDSTNQFVISNSFDLSFPCLVVADQQSSGRGRLGRVWSSQCRGFWASYAWLWSKSMYKNARGLSLYVAVELLHYLRAALGPEHQSSLRLKWPNDLYHLERKLGGILIETKSYRNQLLVVIGVGINYDTPPIDQAIGFSEFSDLDFHVFRAKCIDFFSDFSLEGLFDESSLESSLNRSLAYRYEPVLLTHADGRSIFGVLQGVSSSGVLRLETLEGTCLIDSTEWSLRPQ